MIPPTVGDISFIYTCKGFSFQSGQRFASRIGITTTGVPSASVGNEKGLVRYQKHKHSHHRHAYPSSLSAVKEM